MWHLARLDLFDLFSLLKVAEEGSSSKKKFGRRKVLFDLNEGSASEVFEGRQLTCDDITFLLQFILTGHVGP